MFNLLSASLQWKFGEPIVYVSFAVIAALLVAGTIVFFAAKSKFAAYAKYALLGLFGYALVAGIVMLVKEIIGYYGEGGDYATDYNVIKLVFIPILVTAALIIITAVTVLILSKSRPETAKTYLKIAGGVCLASLVVTLILIAIYFSKSINGDGYYTGDYGKLNETLLYISAALLVIVAASAAIVFDKEKFAFDTKTISFAGITIALSFALSYVKFVKLPQGGSVTLASLLPIMLFSYVYGIKKGLVVGLIYGVLQAVQDPYIVHPAQFLLDYPVAFALTGFAGILKNVTALDKCPQVKFALSATIGATLRFVAHVLSGVFAFGAYAKDAGASNVLVYSLAYNSFVFIDLILVIVVGVILFSSKSFINELGKFTATAAPSDEKQDKQA